MYMCICVCVCMCVCVWVCTCVYVCVYICRYIYFLWLGLTLISTMRRDLPLISGVSDCIEM